MQGVIYLIETQRINGASLKSVLSAAGYPIQHFHILPDAIKQARQDCDLVIINAAASRTSGVRLATKARRQIDAPVILISAEGTWEMPSEPGFEHLVYPFTPRKLVNRIRKLLPPDGCKVQKAGGLRLVPEQRKVIVNGKQNTLTPKTYALLNEFVKREGEVVTRKELMRRVWKTDYMGDVRTLDVHISMLRHALEEDSLGPQRLITIRGVGYRLDSGVKKATQKK